MLSASLLGLGKIPFKKHWFAISFMILLFSITNLDILGQYRTAFEKIIFNRSSGIELVHPVAKYVRDNTNPEETVLVWGTQPYINLLARRDSPTGILFYPQLADTPFTNNLNDKFYQDLVQNKPVLIVDMVTLNNDSMPFIDPMRRAEQESRLKMFTPPSNLELVFNFIHQNYHLETIVGGVPIYRINENTP